MFERKNTRTPTQSRERYCVYFRYGFIHIEFSFDELNIRQIFAAHIPMRKMGVGNIMHYNPVGGYENSGPTQWIPLTGEPNCEVPLATSDLWFSLNWRNPTE